MIFEKENLTISAKNQSEEKAALLFAAELGKRTGVDYSVCKENGDIVFCIVEESDSETFAVSLSENRITVTAHRLRGLIYGFGLLLRKAKYSEDKIYFDDCVFGEYNPCMKIRGHGLGYTDMSNTYEAWDEVQYRQYILELMFFGLNTVEASYATGKGRTKLMKYSFEEAMGVISGVCKELDVSFTAYRALSRSLTNEQTLDDILNIVASTPQTDALFLPGGDPGDLQGDEFVDRCIFVKNGLKEIYPDLELQVSAQAPHEYPDWGEKFAEKMADLPKEISAVIYGPNHAMSLDELRRCVDKRYPIIHYPDIGHNLRCETPVHFKRDDWHFVWASTLSRECVNPRPNDYRLYHLMTRSYSDGSVSYSEGVNDDINKAIWSALDFEPDCSLRTVLKDYCRVFLPGAVTSDFADAVFGLEVNWVTDPVENPCVESTYRAFEALGDKTPSLKNNWRYLLLLFKARCDKIVRDRRIFELELIEKAEREINYGNIDIAKEILLTPFPESYTELRSSINTLAEKLFELIGIQLDVEHFGGMQWERGCTLDTIDMPVTDRQYLLRKINENPSADYMREIISRNKVDKDEFYFSFSLHGAEMFEAQQGEVYYNFKGDQNAEALLPVCAVKNYDNFTFKADIAGLTGGNYELRVSYHNSPNPNTHHTVKINGTVIFEGEQYGGERDEDFEKKHLSSEYRCIAYKVPSSIICNGCVHLEISEPTVGFEMCEFRFTKEK